MTCFLTSSSCVLGAEELNPANGFREAICCAITPGSRCLFISSSPEDHDTTERHAASIRRCFENSGVDFSEYIILDNRNCSKCADLVASAQVIILAGGHVPTQNEFFNRIGLRDALTGFDGVLMGISAGTMNSASTVYAHVELPGEATDPEYKKFLPGLSLTDTMVIPHYYMIKDDVLDGLRVFDDVAYPDSMGREFHVLPDGSYIYIHDDKEYLHGEAFLLKDGVFRRIAREGDIIRLK